jgi:hypothetical protein
MGCRGIQPGSRWRGLAASLAVLPAVFLAAGSPAQAAAPPASPPAGSPQAEPAATTTSRPAGKWTCWSADRYFGVRAATPKALWLAGWTDAQLWRYDVATRKMQVFSALDGLPLDEGPVVRIVDASDEQCAVLIGRNQSKTGVFLWDPNRGWRSLPPVGAGSYVRDVAFDSRDRVLVLCAEDKGCRVSRFDSNAWQAVSLVGDSTALAPVPGGFVATQVGTGAVALTYVPDSGPARTTYSRIDPFNRSPFPCFRTGGRTLCMPIGTGDRILGTERGFDLTADGFREAIAGKFIGVDLKAGGFFGSKVLETTEELVRVKPELAGAPVIDLRYDSTSSFQPLGDQNGHLWMGRRRWDGREWKDFAGGFDLASRYRFDSEDVKLSADGTTWSPASPDLPAGAACYDSNTRTAWMASSRDGNTELQFVRFAGAQHEVLRAVPYDTRLGMPKFQDPNGDWWWHETGSGTLSAGMVCRLTPSGLRRYSGYEVYLSPRATVWSMGGSGSWGYRYDANSDSFVPGEPWDDFSFDLGAWKLSLICDINNSWLYRKTEEGWSPLRTPFSHFEAKAYGNAVHGDRLLVSVADVGVLEYNATHGQWARLTETNARARFDQRGRRVLWGFGLLVYDGDPWVDLPRDDSDEAAFARLIKQLDDDQFSVREAASKQLAREMARFRQRTRTAVDDPSLSEEVRARLRELLPDEDAPLPAPTALLRRMHPIVPP